MPKPFALGVLALSVLAFPAYAADAVCGKPRGGQFAEETLCATELLMPDGRAAGAALLDAIPDQYPWIVRAEEPGAAPFLIIRVTPADATFTTVSVLNGYSPHDSSGSERTPFARYARARDVLIETASGHSVKATLADSQELQHIALPSPAASGWVKLTLLSAYPGESPLIAVRWFTIAWEADM